VEIVSFTDTYSHRVITSQTKLTNDMAKIAHDRNRDLSKFIYEFFTVIYKNGLAYIKSRFHELLLTSAETLKPDLNKYGVW